MMVDKKEYKILVVEDNPGDLLLITDCIEEIIVAPKITNARNFKETQDLLFREDIIFDVILLDLSLPDRTGKELIMDIVSKIPNTPIIVLTGYTDFAFSIQSISLGITDYMLKEDITPASLYKSIVYSIERKRIDMKLKESEKRYSNLFHLSPQPMWIYDLETLKYVQVNKFAIQQYGYSETEFLNMTLLDLRAKEEHEYTIAAYKNFISQEDRTDSNPFIGRFKHLTKFGEQLEVDIYSNPIKINDKNYGFVIGIDVTDKVLFDNKMTKAIIQAQENERNEIGSELHDNVCQLLATCQLGFNMVESSLPIDKLPYYEQSKNLLNHSLSEIRNLSHRLAPSFFSDTTLRESLKDLLTTFNVENRYVIDLNITTAVDEIQLSRDLHLNLFRILQEQLRNILKYANATNIKVQVDLSEVNLEMKIRDNGVGFEPHSVRGGIGFTNMQRRVEMFKGKILIQSSLGNGCDVHIEIPLNECIDKIESLDENTAGVE